MADYFPGKIEIGGVVPRHCVEELIAEIVETKASLDEYCQAEVTEEALKNAIEKKKILTLCQDQARYGEFEELEGFLLDNGIHFNRHSDAYYEFDAEMIFFRGDDVSWFPSTQPGELLLLHCDVEEVLQKEISDSEKVAMLRRVAFPPELKPLTPLTIQEDHDHEPGPNPL